MKLHRNRAGRVSECTFLRDARFRGKLKKNTEIRMFVIFPLLDETKFLRQPNSPIESTVTARNQCAPMGYVRHTSRVHGHFNRTRKDLKMHGCIFARVPITRL